MLATRSLLRAALPLALPTFLLLAPTSTHATTQVSLTLEDLIAQSDVIARGRVIDTTVFPEGPSALPGIHTRVTLAVDELLAGAASDTLTFWTHGGRLGNRMRVLIGQAHFTPGEDVVVFLFRTPQGDLFPSGMARGKWVVSHDGSETWVTPAAPLSGAEGHDGLRPQEGSTLTASHDPRAAEVLRLNELERRVMELPIP